MAREARPALLKRQRQTRGSKSNFGTIGGWLDKLALIFPDGGPMDCTSEASACPHAPCAGNFTEVIRNSAAGNAGMKASLESISSHCMSLCRINMGPATGFEPATSSLQVGHLPPRCYGDVRKLT